MEQVHDGLAGEREDLEPADEDIEAELQSSGREVCGGYSAVGGALGGASAAMAGVPFGRPGHPLRPRR